MEKILIKEVFISIIRKIKNIIYDFSYYADSSVPIKNVYPVYSDHDYLNFNPFDADFEEGIRCRTIKMVKTRKDHQCALNDHIIPKGSTVRFEKAIVEGKWGSYYVCKPCMINWFREIGV